MNTDEMMAVHKAWYSIPEVAFQIARSAYGREFALLPPKWIDHSEASTRCLRCHNTAHFNFLMCDLLHAYQKAIPYQCYCSLASYAIDGEPGIPRMSANLQARDTQGWRHEHWKHMVGYDWLIDIDSPSHSAKHMDLARQTALSVVDELTLQEMPMQVRYSGCGYHIIVPASALRPDSYDPDNEESTYKFLLSETKKLADDFGELIDLGVNDDRRVTKAPYSLSIYRNGIFAVWPLKNRKELERFEPGMAAAARLIDDPGLRAEIRDRGTPTWPAIEIGMPVLEAQHG